MVDYEPWNIVSSHKSATTYRIYRICEHSGVDLVEQSYSLWVTTSTYASAAKWKYLQSTSVRWENLST